MSSDAVDSSQSQAIQDEIAELEERLEKAKTRLNRAQANQGLQTPPPETPRSDGRQDFSRFLGALLTLT
jgi:urease accessory protein